MNEFHRIVRINDVALFQEGEGEEGESVGSDVEGEFHQFKFLINCLALNCLEKSAIFCGSVSYSYQDYKPYSKMATNKLFFCLHVS